MLKVSRVKSVLLSFKETGIHDMPFESGPTLTIFDYSRTQNVDAGHYT